MIMHRKGALHVMLMSIILQVKSPHSLPSVIAFPLNNITMMVFDAFLVYIVNFYTLSPPI